MATPGGWSGALKFLKYAQCVRSNFGHFYSNRTDIRCTVPRPWIIRFNMYASDVKGEQTAMKETSELNPKKKKVFIPRVTLLSETDEISIVTLDTADKVAKRRNLKLVKIQDFDAKTERPTYKLMSTKEYLQEGLIRKKQKQLDRETSLKPEKIVSVSTKINEHDLQVKFKNVVKFLTKRHEVRFLISIDGNEEKCAEICTQLETVTKDIAAKVNKSKSSNKMKINLLPNIEKKDPVSPESEAKDTQDGTPVAAAS